MSWELDLTGSGLTVKTVELLVNRQADRSSAETAADWLLGCDVMHDGC